MAMGAIAAANEPVDGKKKRKRGDADAGETGDKGTADGRPAKHKGKHDKPKPWDTPDIDHWKLEKFDPSWNQSGMLEESSFSTLFPQYREGYLREAWPLVTRALKEHGIKCELNLVEGSMTVSTTRKTRDPFIIIKARDLLKLLSRSVPAPQALKILEDEMQCDIIKIGNIIRNKDRFVKRRQRLIGPNGATLKAIEVLTGCYMLVQGSTVAAMGPWKGLKAVRRIAEDCIKNMHPIYHIKAMMIKRDLARDPELADQNWDRYLPNFKKKNVQRKKTKQQEKKAYSPFPPPPQPSKIDMQLESGEYFLSADMKAARSWEAKKQKQSETVAEKKRKREAAFVPPTEPKAPRADSTEAKTPASHASQSDISSMAASLKKKVKRSKVDDGDGKGVDAYVVVPKPEKKKSK